MTIINKFFIYLTTVCIIYYVSICSTYGQHIQGSILDAYSQDKISFANIYYPATNTGTLSNENGDYYLQVKQYPIQLIISHLNYGSDTVTIIRPSDNNTFYLKPVAHELAPITVNNVGYKLIKQAFDRADTEEKSAVFGKAFYRQLTINGEQPTEIQEVVYEVKLSSNKIEGIQINNARYAKMTSDDKKIYVGFTNFSYLVLAQKAIGRLKPAKDVLLLPLRPDVADYYDVRVTDILTQANGEKIAKLDCQVREEYTNPAFSGQVYINMTNYKLVKVHGTIPDNMGAVIIDP
ncbi:carboxypeptidase-like regulatory domain-containing protein [Spirosoma linguale]